MREDCERTRELLSRWVDGHLSASDAEAIRLHLGGCAACDRERRQLEKLEFSLKSVWCPMCHELTSSLSGPGSENGLQKSPVDAKQSWNGHARHLPHRHLLGLSPQ